MSVAGVSEHEWRQVSASASQVDAIRINFERLMTAISQIATEAAKYVADLSVEVDLVASSAVIKSFAGVADARLAWRVKENSIEGVMVVTSARSDGIGLHDVLHVFVPAYGSPYLILENGEVVQLQQMQAVNFAYAVLMNVVRKQVDLSIRL